MGILDRLMTMIKAKISTFLDRHEDPRETLDYSYEKPVSYTHLTLPTTPYV